MLANHRLRGLILAAACLALAASTAFAAGRMRFWNETAVTIVELYLAPAGTSRWTTNQCNNDPDKSVDPDERLTITGVDPGRYDVKLTEKGGTQCLVHNVEVKGDGPFAFAISDGDLKDCSK